VVVIALAVGAALCNAVASVLQRLAARSAPDEQSLHLQLLAYLLRRPLWMAGILAMMGAFVLQAAALTRGSLSVVQPLLVSELLFVLGILAVCLHVPVSRRDWFGAAMVVVGLGGFLTVANPVPGGQAPGLLPLIGTGIATLAVVVTAVSLSQHGTSARKAALLGAAAGATFGLTAALTKIFTVSIVSSGFAGAFASWAPYALAVTGISAVFLAQNAFQAGPLAASQPAFTIVDPLVSVSIGVVLFGDRLRTAGWDVLLELLTFALMAVGVVVLSRSPRLHGDVSRAPTTPHVPAGSRH
jgi:drug/metabolite transporter (DMT)-like permease